MKSFVIAGNSLRRFFRDRTSLFFTIALPIVIITLIGTATSGFDNDSYPIGVVVLGDADSEDLAQDLREGLEAHELLDVKAYEEREALAKDVRRGTIPAGVIVPADYDAQLNAGKVAQVELLIDQTRGPVAEVRSSIAEVIADRGGVLQAARFARKQTGATMDVTLREARGATSLLEPVAVGVKASAVGRSEDRDYLPPGIGYQAPSNLILFVFITSLGGSALLITSRKLRVTQRMYATPTPARAILFGEGLARFAIAGFQAAFIFLVGTLVFGVEWGQPVGATALIFLFVLVGTAVGLLFGTIFSTPEQAGSIGSMVGIGMGMLGGCMWPLEIVPKPMQTLGHVFPHAWAMDAWIELIGRGGTIGDITTELAVLGGFVAVLLPLAVWRLRRALVS